jgi:hypothetical protein
MAKWKSTTNKLPPFVALTWQMLNHKAYQDLPASAAKALPYFLGKVQGIPFKDPARYHKEFYFPFSEAGRLGFPRATFSTILSALISYGWIDPVHKGGLKGTGLGRNTFRLSNRWEAYPKPSFLSLDWKGFMS